MPTNLAAVTERCGQIQQGKYKKTPYMKFKEGPNYIRILPPFGERDRPFVEFKKVFKLGPNGSHIVPRAQFGLDDCPFEEYYNELQRHTDEASKKELDSVRLKNRVAFMVINRAEEATGPQVWECSLDILAAVGALFSNPEWGDISNENTGVDLCVIHTPSNKTKDGFADYQIQPQRHSTPLTPIDSQWKEWMGKDWFKEYKVGEPSSVEWIRAVLTGTEKELNNKGNSNQEGNENGAAPAAGPQTLAPPVGVPSNPYPFDANAPFYAFLNGAAQKITAQQVYQYVCSGNDVQCCPENDSANGWRHASALGFKKPEPVSAPPSGPPMGPPPSPTATKAPWEDLPPTEPTNPVVSAPVGGGSVADDIRSQLAAA